MLDFSDLNLSVYDQRCKDLNTKLMNLRSKYIDSNVNLEYVTEYILNTESFAVIIKFMSKLARRKLVFIAIDKAYK